MKEILKHDEQFWIESVKTNRCGNERKEVSFHYSNCFRFLENRGFGRLIKPDGSFTLARIENKECREINGWEIRDFILTFAKKNCIDEVYCMLLKGIGTYLNDFRLNMLSILEEIQQEEIPENN